MKTNTIAQAILTRRDLPATARKYGETSITFQAIAKLEQIGGNKLPHFSVTGTIWKGTGPYSDKKDIAGGCLHDDIAQVFPKLRPLIALHLSHSDGQPMHAAANGLYWVAGFVPGNLCQQYHGASGDHGKTPEECLRIAADHLRITVYETEALGRHLSEVCEKAKQTVATSEEVSPAAQKEQAKQARIAVSAAMAAYCETQRERWQREANEGLALIRELATVESVSA